MNLFVLHYDPNTAASYMCDKHFKMITEYAQILYAVLQHHWQQTMPDVKLPNGTLAKPYRVAYKHHPVVLWAAACEAHAQWIVTHAQMLAIMFSAYSTTCDTHTCQHHINAIDKYMHAHEGLLMPQPLSLAEFQAKYPQAADKASSLHPPDGCDYGVVCADPPDDVPDVKVFYKGQLSVVDSYRRLYAYKGKFKFPMEWMRSTIMPSDLEPWFDTYAPNVEPLTRKRKRVELEA